MERHLLAHAGARPRYLSDIWAFGCLVLEVSDTMFGAQVGLTA